MRVKPDEKINDVLSMGLQQAASFDIADPQKFISLILDNSYKDPITATVREICQNASEVIQTSLSIYLLIWNLGLLSLTTALV